MTDSGNSFILEFSKESLDAAFTELKSVQEAFGNFSIEFFIDGIAKIKGDVEPAKRLSFIRYASRIIQEAVDIEELKGLSLPPGKFNVRINRGNSNSTISESLIGETIGGMGRISFSAPDFRLRAIYSRKWYLCLLEYQSNRSEMEARKAPLRPFFSPVSMHPKYARFMVNSLSLKPGATILDPFCGTGGILIEAAKLGYRVIGNDISLKMFKGARLNLKFMGIADYGLHNKDFLDLVPEKKVNGIVTDLPYGRSSSLGAYSIEELYSKTIDKFASMLEAGEKCCVAVSSQDIVKMAEKHFEVSSIIPVRQHRSLTRYYITMVRQESSSL